VERDPDISEVERETRISVRWRERDPDISEVERETWISVR
jgi:hypothetical protein